MSGALVLYESFKAGCRRAPHGLAAISGEAKLTYGDLDDASLSLSVHLRDAQGSGPRAVALLCSHSINLYIAYLAVARNAGTVIPLDPSQPLARVTHVLRTTGCTTIITDVASPLLEELKPVVRRTVSAARQSPLQILSVDPVAEPFERDAAYIMFTSGSTGVPKGVPVLGESVSAYLSAISDILPMGPGDRHSQVFSPAFDLSVHDMFVTWSKGGALCAPMSRRAAVMVDRYVRHYELTHWFSVPTAIDLGVRAEALGPNSAESLKWASFCGEPLAITQARRFMTAAPNANLCNLYGPTEATIACTAFHVSNFSDIPTTRNGTVPIGTPLSGVTCRVRRSSPELPNDTEGELVVSGRQVISGYVAESDDVDRFIYQDAIVEVSSRLSDEARLSLEYRTGDLVERTAAGYVHKGRLDDQIKISGYRIEPAEVEYHLRQHRNITSVVVVVISPNDATASLMAVYTGEEVESHELRRYLMERVPSYMVPFAFSHVESLPINANGKVSKRLVVEGLTVGTERQG